jgi:two-component system chemotaxis sensor kinase CheA
MDEFLQQFMVEARELVEQATEDLLALERSPMDKERLDSAFRAFHTLKGGAAIVEFGAMEEAMHTAENGLSDARSGERPVTPSLIGDYLLCLDQVSRWMEVIESTGELPADPGPAAAALTARFSRAAQKPDPAGSAARGTGSEWLAGLKAKFADKAPLARSAIRYQPEADSFFKDQDPLALIAALPGLLALDAGPVAQWPALEDLDPFACHLAIAALSSATPEEVADALGDERRLCTIERVQRTDAPTAGEPLLQPAHALLEAQLALLGESAERGAAGRMASAGTVAANVFRHLSRLPQADRIASATAASLAARDAEPLRQAIRDELGRLALPASERAPAIPVGTGSQPTSQATQTLRVDAERIDALVKLTGELLVVKNAIGHSVKLAEDERSPLGSALKNRHAELERLVLELQRAVLGIRVLPLRVAFQRFPRLVREMSSALGKPVTLTIEGENTEADKTIVEVLVEPLLHVLRNAMDHGIESPGDRAGSGKPPGAKIRLRAAREGEHVLIEVSDDGRGIDMARVRSIAKQRGLVTEEALATMEDAQVTELVFEPGFSTAATVTGLSGRGVGMDAVRTAVRRLGGQVTLKSEPGRGTTVVFALPFSVMMTQVMTVEAAGQVYGIPLDAITETVRVPRTRIQPVGTGHVIVLRNITVPLLELAQVVGAKRDSPPSKEATIVVVRVEGHSGALEVDKIGERMQVLLKPLEGLLAGMRGIAGSALLGDGSVLPVLDLAELLR